MTSEEHPEKRSLWQWMKSIFETPSLSIAGFRGTGPTRHTRSAPGQSTRYSNEKAGGLGGMRKRPRWGRKLNSTI